MRQAALDYASRGWKVFPCHCTHGGACSCGNPKCVRPGKHPRTAHGLNDATDDADIITVWWTRWPDANIGIYAHGSGLAVVDVDPGKGGDDSWQTLVDTLGSDLEDTLCVRTGSGGRHFYYLEPPGPLLTNKSDWMPGIDTRTAGYVIAPPSSHVTGGVYSVLDDMPVVVMPDALADWFRTYRAPAPEPRARPLPADLPHNRLDDPRADSYAQAALERELCELSAARPGNQNTALNKAAFCLGQLVAGGLLSRIEVEIALERTMLALPIDSTQGPWTPENMAATMKSGLEGGMQHPRGLPVETPMRPVGQPAASSNGATPADTPFLPSPDVEALRLAPLSLSDLFAQAEAAGDIQWLVPNGIARGYVHLLSAPPKSGKTWFGLTLARAVCRGEPWAGLAGIQQGGVLWIDEEMGAQLLVRRLKQLSFGPDLPFYTLSLAGFRIDQGGDVSRVMKAVRDLDVSLVVVDSLRRCHQFEENDNSAMRGLMPYMKALASTNAAVVVLHHDRKRTLNDGDAQERSSGALDLIAQVDMVYGMKRSKDTFTLTCRSARLVGEEQAASIAFRLRDRDDGTVEVQSLDAEVEGKHTQEHIEACILFHLLAHPGDNTRGVHTAVHGRVTEISAALNRMVDDGRLRLEAGPRNSKNFRVADGVEPPPLEEDEEYPFVGD